MIIFAFVVGYMLQGMVKNMCSGGLLEGAQSWESNCETNSDCNKNEKCKLDFGGNHKCMWTTNVAIKSI